jgi:uncharacterized membrane protein YozB (DUF420 family)
MIDATQLPTVNATLNGIAAVLLVIGWVLIRRRKIRAHRAVMLTAFACSILFLISYLVYHYQVGSVRFQGEGAIRTVYFTILISHTLLATAVPFLAAITLFRALKERFAKHRAIARCRARRGRRRRNRR